MYTWRKEWVNKYESTWGVLEKFKYANMVSNTELYQLLGEPNQIGIIRGKLIEDHKSYITMNGFNENKVKSVLGVNLKEKNNNDILGILSVLLKNRNIKGKDIEKYFDKNIRICPVCIKEAYHSILHQCNLFDYCFIHDQKLLEVCPKCNHRNLYEFNDNNNDFGFRCLKCGHLYFEYSYTFFEKWNRNITNIKTNYKKWLDLNNKHKDRYIITYSYDIQNEKKQEKKLNYNQICDIFFYILDNPINMKISNLKVVAYKEIYSAKDKDLNLTLMDIRHQLYKSYKAILKSISRNLINRNEYIRRNIRSIGKNKYKVYFYQNEIKKYNISKIIDNLDVKLDDQIYWYSYILWRRDIDGLDSYEDVHTKSYYGDYIYSGEAFYYRATKSEIYKYVEYCYNEYTIYKHSKPFDFICIIENIMAYMLLQHYKNWMEFFTKSLRENLITKNTISNYMEEKMPYNMPNFIMYNSNSDKFSIDKIKFCAFLNNKNYKCR